MQMREVQKRMLKNYSFKIQLQIIITTATIILATWMLQPQTSVPWIVGCLFLRQRVAVLDASDKFDTGDPSALRGSQKVEGLE